MSGLLYNTIALLGLSVLFVLELTDRRFRRSLTDPDTPRMRRHLAYLGASLVVTFLLRQIGDAAQALLPAVFDWKQHVILNALGCFFVAELFGWVLHYVKHKHAYLWRFHFQHHIEPEYDIWLVTNTHALEVLISGTITASALTLLGFSTLSIQIYFLFYALANTYQHSTNEYSLGWLDRIIVNPAYHRLHHAVGSDVNFGNTLTVWDMVFRTAAWPVSAAKPDVEIGIGAGPEPYGFADEMGYFADTKPRRPEEVRVSA